MIQAALRSVMAEPAIPNAPQRVWRDWALLGTAALTGTVEAIFRNDDEWAPLPLAWKIAAWLILLCMLPAFLVRRQEPLRTVAWVFGLALGFSALVWLRFDHPGGLMTGAIVLVAIYALYRWGSGRAMLVGAAACLFAWVFGNLVDNEGLGEWIGGFIVLTIPIEAGLLVRYRASHRERSDDEARNREREMIARELHDSVAHHVSAIAVQAQAGQAMAVHDPERAVAVLSVIEEAAARTLDDMRQMIGTLRDESGAELVPRQGITDLARLARNVPGDIAIHVEVDQTLGSVGAVASAAVFRIAQESITNATRHARDATTVRVTVAPDGDDVKLNVVDDGRATQRNSTGFGLRGMAERSQLLGGTFTAGPMTGGGWQVRASIPRVTS